MGIRLLFAALVLVLAAAPIAAQAGELRQLYRGARAQAMGGAYVGLADDEQAIFLNPAGLAGSKRYTFHYAVADLSVSSDTVSSISEGAEAFSSATGDSLNVVMGKNIYAQAQMTSLFMMPNLGVAAIVDQQYALRSHNRAMPSMVLGQQTTNGVQVAYGVSLGRGHRSKSDIRVGVGAKMLWRRGGYDRLPLMTVVSMSRQKLKELAGNFERGYGADLGFQYINRPNKQWTLSAGSAFTDVGDTNFGGGPDSIKGNLGFGWAISREIRRAKITFAYEYAHLLEETDWRKKQHFGLEAALPFLALYGGVNQTYLTYGASIDLWLLKITALSYAEEQGSYVHQDPERRYTVKLAMKFDL